MEFDVRSMAQQMSIGRQLGAISAAQNMRLLGAAMKGAALRKLIEHGEADLAADLEPGGRPAVDLMMTLDDILHQRLRRGERLAECLAGMRVDGWLLRLDMLEPRAEGGAQ